MPPRAAAGMAVRVCGLLTEQVSVRFCRGSHAPFSLGPLKRYCEIHHCQTLGSARLQQSAIRLTQISRQSF